MSRCLCSIRNELIVVWELNLEEQGVSKVSCGSMTHHSYVNVVYTLATITVCFSALHYIELHA